MHALCIVPVSPSCAPPPQSISWFERARKAAPYRIEGMEYYSTALWHLKKEAQLSHLAQQVCNTLYMTYVHTPHT